MSTSYIIEYKLNNGMKMSRKYSIKEKDYKEYIQNLVKSDEYYEETTKDLGNKVKYITVSYYKNGRYNSLTIKESEQQQFIQDLKEDIKNNKAIISNIFNVSLIDDNYKQMNTRVEVDFLDNSSKYISYIDSSLSNSNLKNYIK